MCSEAPWFLIGFLGAQRNFTCIVTNPIFLRLQILVKRIMPLVANSMTPEAQDKEQLPGKETAYKRSVFMHAVADATNRRSIWEQ